MEKPVLILKEATGRERRVALPEKGIVLVVDYTNEKFAAQLQRQGVPLVADKTPEETQQKQLVKKMAISLRHGGGSPKPFLLPDNAIIEGVGRGPIRLPANTTVNGRELLTLLLELAKRRGIQKTFIRTRVRATETGLSKGKERQKFVTKLYLYSKVYFPDKKGAQPVNFEEAEKMLGCFLDAPWYLHLYDNPDTFVFQLTFKDPERQGRPVLHHSLSLFFDFKL